MKTITFVTVTFMISGEMIGPYCFRFVHGGAACLYTLTQHVTIGLYEVTCYLVCMFLGLNSNVKGLFVLTVTDLVF